MLLSEPKEAQARGQGFLSGISGRRWGMRVIPGVRGRDLDLNSRTVVLAKSLHLSEAVEKVRGVCKAAGRMVFGM